MTTDEIKALEMEVRALSTALAGGSNEYALGLLLLRELRLLRAALEPKQEPKKRLNARSS